MKTARKDSDMGKCEICLNTYANYVDFKTKDDNKGVQGEDEGLN